MLGEAGLICGQSMVRERKAQDTWLLGHVKEVNSLQVLPERESDVSREPVHQQVPERDFGITYPDNFK